MSGPGLPAIAIHGGAWSIPDSLAEASVKGVQRAAREGDRVLRAGGSALDAVQAAVVVMEDDPAFDAGTGSVLTMEGEVEMDAVIMEGKGLRAGAVACVQNIKNPVCLARLVLDKTDHVLLAGPGANKFAAECGVESVPTDSLVTPEARQEWETHRKYKTTVNTFFKTRQEVLGHDTVGAVAVDKTGSVAFATSTGGISAKRPGRVGDTPIIGSGGYADDKAGAVSSTGHGEGIMRVCLAKTVTDLMQTGMSSTSAAQKALLMMSERVGSSGGVVVVSPKGDVGQAFTTDRMAWAWVKDGQMHYGLEPGEDNVVSVDEDAPDGTPS